MLIIYNCKFGKMVLICKTRDVGTVWMAGQCKVHGDGAYFNFRSALLAKAYPQNQSPWNKAFSGTKHVSEPNEHSTKRKKKQFKKKAIQHQPPSTSSSIALTSFPNTSDQICRWPECDPLLSIPPLSYAERMSTAFFS